MRGEQSTKEHAQPAGAEQVTQTHDLALFEKHRDLFELFTRGRFEVRPPKPGMNTFAVDLTPLAKGERAIVYASPAFYERTGRVPEKAVNSFLHELNHIEEIVQLLKEEGGTQVWRRDQARKKTSRRLAMLDNIQDDVRMDRGILEKAPAQREVQYQLYREDLYPTTDYEKMPRHVQFMYALFRESMISDEPCTVAPEVRTKLDELKSMKGKSGRPLWNFHTSTAIPPSVRIALREKYLEPILEELFEKDAEEAKVREQEQGDGQGEGGEHGEPSQGVGSGLVPDRGGAQGPTLQEPSTQEALPKNLEQYFTKWYDEFDAKNPDHAFDEKSLEQAIAQAAKAIEDEQKKTPADKALEAYAKAEGITVAELKQYQHFHDALEKMVNPETNEAVIEEIRAIFRKIIAERMEKISQPRYPREEGDLLYDPAGAVSATKAGEEEPAIWMTHERTETPAEKYGAFDITVVGDRSGSMKGAKAVEQRKAMMLIVEALREFCEELDDARKNLAQDLEVRSEARTFGDAAQNELLKPLGEVLTEKQRVYCYGKLADVSGKDTQDWAVLKEISAAIPEEDVQRMAEKKLRKIVIVLTDGESGNPAELSAALTDLRGKGVTVAAVGITKEGQAVESSYAPDGQVCPQAEALGVTLGNLLKKFLKDL